MNNATLFHSHNLEAKLKELYNFKPYFSDFTLVASINHKEKPYLPYSFSKLPRIKARTSKMKN